MAEIINFNKQRKAKLRVEKEKTASKNRAKFGRTKLEKQQEILKTQHLTRHLDGHILSSDKD